MVISTIVHRAWRELVAIVRSPVLLQGASGGEGDGNISYMGRYSNDLRTRVLVADLRWARRRGIGYKELDIQERAEAITGSSFHPSGVS